MAENGKTTSIKEMDLDPERFYLEQFNENGISIGLAQDGEDHLSFDSLEYAKAHRATILSGSSNKNISGFDIYHGNQKLEDDFIKINDNVAEYTVGGDN